VIIIQLIYLVVADPGRVAMTIWGVGYGRIAPPLVPPLPAGHCVMYCQFNFLIHGC